MNSAVSMATATTLADFTNPGLVIPRLREGDAASVIQELSQALQQEKRIPDLLPFYHNALNREYMVGTDIEAGMAFPHARMPALREVSFALGRSEHPLAWGVKTVRSVRLVFLMAVPATDATQYLLLISGLTRLAKDNQLIQKLLSAPDAFQMFEALKQVELRSISNLSRRTIS